MLLSTNTPYIFFKKPKLILKLIKTQIKEAVKKIQKNSTNALKTSFQVISVEKDDLKREWPDVQARSRNKIKQTHKSRPQVLIMKRIHMHNLRKVCFASQTWLALTKQSEDEFFIFLNADVIWGPCRFVKADKIDTATHPGWNLIGQSSTMHKRVLEAVQSRKMLQNEEHCLLRIHLSECVTVTPTFHIPHPPPSRMWFTFTPLYQFRAVAFAPASSQ